jgi:hypothetical protein
MPEAVTLPTRSVGTAGREQHGQSQSREGLEELAARIDVAETHAA